MVIRIAFYPMGGKLWTGGSVYLRNLLIALKTTYPEQVETVFILQPGVDQATYAEIAPYIDEFLVEEIGSTRKGDRSQSGKLPEDKLPEDKLPEENLPEDKLPEDVDLMTQSTSPAQSRSEFFQHHHIDVIFNRVFSQQFDVPTIGWIPDFQHLHLPDMFRGKDRRARNRKFRRIVRNTTRMMLSSESACSDFRQFAPDVALKASVARFVSAIPASVYDLDLDAVRQEYHLPEKFIYLPNQFWRHKNHRVAFEAAKILKDRGVDVFLVCTGSPFDPRNPNYFAELYRQISQWGIRDRVAFLGLVPHAHVYALMRQSVCVLNPSLFEGWSTTVEEVKSVGKPIVLSNLDVHVEQAPPGGVYFDPHQPEDLAQQLQQIWENTSPGPNVEMEAAARSQLIPRLNAFAHAFVDIAQMAIAEHDLQRQQYVEQERLKREKQAERERLAKAKNMRTIAHIINPVKVGESSDLYHAQPIVFESMRQAQAVAQDAVNVSLLSVQYPEDHAVVPAGFEVTPDLERSILDVGTFQNPRKLPLLKDILDRLYEASEAEYFIYTNADIALMPYFYVAVNRLIDMGFDAFVINRRTISGRYKSIKQLPLMYAEAGKSHPGYDCFVFRREVYPKYDVGTICIGINWVGRALLANLIGHATKFKEFKGKHLTFHIGNDRAWKQEDNADYRNHNEAEFLRIIHDLQAQIPESDQRYLSLKAIVPGSKEFKEAKQKKGSKRLNSEEADSKSGQEAGQKTGQKSGSKSGPQTGNRRKGSGASKSQQPKNSKTGKSGRNNSRKSSSPNLLAQVRRGVLNLLKLNR